jgi:2-oxoglutarate decarboxylase
MTDARGVPGGPGSPAERAVDPVAEVVDERSFGPNAWFVDEMAARYRSDPSSVPEGWRDFFTRNAEVAGRGPSEGPTETVTAAWREGPTETVTAAWREGPTETVTAAPVPSTNDGELRVLVGPPAVLARNMEASLGVPTATSVRTVPARVLEVNRAILNRHLGRSSGQKVSLTHLVAYAVAKALAAVPGMNVSYVADADGRGTPGMLQHRHVGLGIAVDIERRDGTRGLLVPVVREADRLGFAEFVATYDELVRRAIAGKAKADDFTGATATVTNPGTFGTAQSVPRLMPGQGVIVGVGAIGYPAGLDAADPDALARLGVGKVLTLTSTYDHRVIQGATSGLFLGKLAGLLEGEDGFYDEVFSSMGVAAEPMRFERDRNPYLEPETFAAKQVQVQRLVNMYRVRGHLIADLDPLRAAPPPLHPELDPAAYGITVWDLDREFVVDAVAGRDRMRLGDALEILEGAYCGTLTVEYMHIQDPEQKRWIQARLEGVSRELPREAKLHVLDRLVAAEAFERFLHTRYVGQKRFGLEGAESTIVMLDAVLDAAASAGAGTAVIGMAHRGRLNVLANIVGKSLEEIFREFEGDLDPESVHGSGDVKYHKGARGVYKGMSGVPIEVVLAPNPSHLEAVDPVVEGMTRALQDRLRGGPECLEEAERAAEGPRVLGAAVGRAPDACVDAVVPVLLHGDAAFAGQGVVVETLNLSQLPGYATGGTVHIVVNNQLGFTTAPGSARSSVYPTDVVKTVQAPVFHVNGDDPEACAFAGRLALEFRNAFHKDVVVDLVCYRLHGHNETDDPSYTQPIMYRLIDAKRSVRKLYTEALVRRGELTVEEAERSLEAFRVQLEAALEAARRGFGGSVPTEDHRRDQLVAGLYAPDEHAHAEHGSNERAGDTADNHRGEGQKAEERGTERQPGVRSAAIELEGYHAAPPTGVPVAKLEALAPVVVAVPEGFALHPKLRRQFEERARRFESGEVDWSLAEALAFASLLVEGTDVRLAGQDTRRGTFSQRHAVLVDQNTGTEWVPLEHLQAFAPGDAVGRFAVVDSLLSEYAALGFEYGYSLEAKDALVAWEAQFGDFANGAQVVIDNFVVSAQEKWGLTSGLVMLLPHGYEGQGPEHSSARLERFLGLAAGDNLRIAQPTTAAQYFHLLRSQVRGGGGRPLVVLTPKSLLRAARARSPVTLLEAGRFEAVLDDPDLHPHARHGVRRLILCTGKIGQELLERRAASGGEDGRVAVVRVEQLFPWPERSIAQAIDRYEAAAEVLWVQEEPENMGAWPFVHLRLHRLLRDGPRLRHLARPPASSPATGSLERHRLEQEAILSAALA